MNTSTNLISITEASKRLGINRSTLNRFINEFEISKKKQGRVALVDFISVQNMIQVLASKGKIRTPTNQKKINHKSESINDHLNNHYRNEINRLVEERNKLEESNKTLTIELDSIKKMNKTIKNENETLNNQMKLIEGKIENIKNGVISKFFHNIGL